MQLDNYEALNAFGDKSKVAVFFDDQVDTIERHIAYVKEQGICAIIAQTTEELIRIMDTLWDKAVFFVDMNIPRVFNMESIGFKDIGTLRCSAYATAVFKAFHLRFNKVLKFPCILSGLDINPKAYDTISDLEDDDFVVDILEKDNFDKFKDVINLYLDCNSLEDKEVNERYQMVGKKLAVCNDFLDEWFDQSEEVKSAAFGFAEVTDYVSYVVNNLVVTQDIEDRCDALYRVKKNLLSLFQDNLEREKRWITRPNPALDGLAPLDLIMEGHQHQLYRLVSVLERV